MNEKEKILNSGILEQYALGLLEGKELQEAENCLQKYPELQEHVSSIQDAMEMIVMQNGIEPPPSLRQNILDEIETMEQLEKTTLDSSSLNNRSIPILPILASLAAIGLVVVGFLFFKKNQQLKDNYQQLESRYLALEKECSEKQVIAAMERDYFLHPATQTVQLTGSTKTPEAFVAIYFNSEKEKAILNIVNLPKPPADKQYQLWADVEGHMESMGVFDADNLDLQEMTFIANASSLNITLESLGGSKEATVEELRASGKV
ncbi:MAG: anti-sigma factor [Bacteroidota bacterium]